MTRDELTGEANDSLQHRVPSMESCLPDSRARSRRACTYNIDCFIKFRFSNGIDGAGTMGQHGRQSLRLYYQAKALCAVLKRLRRRAKREEKRISSWCCSLRSVLTALPTVETDFTTKVGVFLTDPKAHLHDRKADHARHVIRRHHCHSNEAKHGGFTDLGKSKFSRGERARRPCTPTL